LGSETEALRVARAELDKLMKELDAAAKEKENAAGSQGDGKDGKPQPGDARHSDLAVHSGRAALLAP
jgi:hypothetical protein